MSYQKDSKFLALIRATIAIRNVKKADLARACQVDRSTFSAYLHGVSPMPDGVRQVIVEELGLERLITSIGADMGGRVWIGE